VSPLRLSQCRRNGRGSAFPYAVEERYIEKQRINDQIRISPVSVVSQEGAMLGTMSTAAARQMAADVGLDLVEVAPDARPPVCRIMDHGKSQYNRRKKQGEGSKARRTQLKQIRLRAKTGDHDIDFKVRQAETFLRRKDKVKINVMFRGRENAHHERGRQMLEGIIETLKDVASVEKPPSMESGRMMSMILTPKH
jgi:translation initiation factor IF-3